LRVIEIWDEKAGFDRFLETRLGPATEAVGMQRETQIKVTPLHNFFAPRLAELPALIPRRMVRQGDSRRRHSRDGETRTRSGPGRGMDAVTAR
jgi:hypothetical protein